MGRGRWVQVPLIPFTPPKNKKWGVRSHLKPKGVATAAPFLFIG